MHFEVDEIAPVRHPLIEHRALWCFHDLEASRETVIDPARDVVQAFRRHSTTLAKTAVYRQRITVLEALDNHVKRRRHSGLQAAPRPMGSNVHGAPAWSQEPCARAVLQPLTHARG